MRGINGSAKDQIAGVIERLFDRMSNNLLGNIPQLRNKKTILFTSNPTMTLAHLFIHSMGNKVPLPNEQEVLKSLMNTAYDYLEALKLRTKARLTNDVDSYVQEARAKGEAPSESIIREKIVGALKTAGSEFKTIGEAEATKARNMGKLMNIARVGAASGISDPTIFFVVVRDGNTCEHCLRLHMMPDGITPRVYKVSEIGFSYYNPKGPDRDKPRIMGLHPHCRCSNTMLNPGWGFKNGFVSYISHDHDEWKKQRGQD